MNPLNIKYKNWKIDLNLSLILKTFNSKSFWIGCKIFLSPILRFVFFLIVYTLISLIIYDFTSCSSDNDSNISNNNIETNIAKEDSMLDRLTYVDPTLFNMDGFVTKNFVMPYQCSEDPELFASRIFYMEDYGGSLHFTEVINFCSEFVIQSTDEYNGIAFKSQFPVETSEAFNKFILREEYNYASKSWDVQQKDIIIIKHPLENGKPYILRQYNNRVC